MTGLSTKMVDERGRLSLGKEFAEFAAQLVLIKRLGAGVLQIVMAEAVPARESWLYKNPKALGMVMQGIKEAKAGDLVEGPNMQAGDDLVESMGG